MEKNKKRAIIAILIIIVLIICYMIFKPKKNNVVENVHENKYLILQEAGKEGVIDTKGNVIIEPQYTQVVAPDLAKDVFCAYDENKNIKVLNSKKETIFDEYKDLEPVEGNRKDTENQYRPVLRFKKDDKYGLVNLEGKEIVKPIYDEVKAVENDFNNYKVKKDGKYGLVDNDGNIILKEEYTEIKSNNKSMWEDKNLQNGYKIKKMGSNGPIEGFATEKGKIIVPVKYESVEKQEIPSKDYFVVVQEQGKKGLYKNNRQILRSEYQEISSTKNNLIFKRYGKYGMTNLDGKEVIGQRFLGYVPLKDYVVFSNEDKEYAFDKNGNMIGKGMYKIIEVVADGNYIICENYAGERVVIDRKGDEVVNDKLLDVLYAFDDVFIGVKETGYGAYSVKKGNIINCEYEYLNKVIGTKILISSKNEGKETTLYNSNGEKIETKDNFVVDVIKDKVVKIFDATDIKYYDLNGKEIELKNNLDLIAYPFKENNKWGFKNKEGNVVVDAKYDRVGEFNKYGFAAIMKDSKWGSIDSKFNIVLEPEITLDPNIIPKFVGRYLIDGEDNIMAMKVSEGQNISPMD